MGASFKTGLRNTSHPITRTINSSIVLRQSTGPEQFTNRYAISHIFLCAHRNSKARMLSHINKRKSFWQAQYATTLSSTWQSNTFLTFATSKRGGITLYSVNDQTKKRALHFKIHWKLLTLTSTKKKKNQREGKTIEKHKTKFNTFFFPSVRNVLLWKSLDTRSHIISICCGLSFF